MRVKALQALVDLHRIEAAAGTGLEIRTDGFHLDAAVTLDNDVACGLGIGKRRRHNAGNSAAKDGLPEEKGSQAQPSY